MASAFPLSEFVLSTSFENLLADIFITCVVVISRNSSHDQTNHAPTVNTKKPSSFSHNNEATILEW